MPKGGIQISTFFLFAYLEQLFTAVLMVPVRLLDLNCNIVKSSEKQPKVLKCAYFMPIANAALWVRAFSLFLTFDFLPKGAIGYSALWCGARVLKFGTRDLETIAHML